jgi:hypothetical protein
MTIRHQFISLFVRTLEDFAETFSASFDLSSSSEFSARVAMCSQWISLQLKYMTGKALYCQNLLRSWELTSARDPPDLAISSQ